MEQKPPVNFPTKTAATPVLSLRRRSPLEVAAASSAARDSIKAIVAATRTPWGTPQTLDEPQLSELERSLRQLEVMLAEREHVVAETEARLVERERDLAEAEALLHARERLLQAARKNTAADPGISAEERAALAHLKEELEKQEASLKEAKQAVREREAFLEESENKLFEKVQAQQEKETELEQKEEELKARLHRLREREAAIDPAAAAALQAEQEAARKFDEFKE